MKFLFVFSLLLNVIFFLWEFNRGDNPKLQSEQFGGTDKQILLLSELPKISKEIKVLASNTVTASESVATLEQEGHFEADLIILSEATEQAIEKEVTVVADNTTIIAKLDSALVDGDGSENASITTPESILQREKKPAKVIKVADSNALEIEKKLSTLEEKVIEPKVQSDVVEKKDELIEEPVPNRKVTDDGLNNNLLEQKNSYCYQVGPFNDATELKKWQTLNKLELAPIHVFKKDLQVVSGYLVYYPAMEYFSESKKNVAMLRKKGITDLWLFRKGELKGVISLGLFVQKNRAISLQKKLVNKGISVDIMRRYRKEKALFVDVSKQQESFKDTVIFTKNQAVSSCETGFSPTQ